MKVIVIGSGPGGYPAALKLREKGADVTIIEKGEFGGTCLNRGCIPSKALLEIGHRIHNFREILGFASNPGDFGKMNFSWDRIREHKNAIVSKLRSSLEKLFSSRNIGIIRGEASFRSEKEIIVSGESGPAVISFDKAVIAAGTAPAYPGIFSQRREFLTDSDKIFDLHEKPEKLLIVGAGVIGLEMACFFNALGTDVEVAEATDNILPSEDPRISRFLKTSLEKRGIKFRFSVMAEEVRLKGKMKEVIFAGGEKTEANEILIAASRTASFGALLPEKAKVETGKWIKTDKHLRTSNPDIYAVGDINGISLLAHSAEKQGETAAENIMGANEEFEAAFSPKCVYTWPEMASVGISPGEAAEKGINVRVKRAFFRGLGRAVASIQEDGLCQIVLGGNGEILGSQIVGGPATEIIHPLALAVRMKLKEKDLKSAVYAHPTMSEIIKETLSK